LYVINENTYRQLHEFLGFGVSHTSNSLLLWGKYLATYIIYPN